MGGQERWEGRLEQVTLRGQQRNVLLAEVCVCACVSHSQIMMRTI